jgi:hypothetical protein
VPDRLLADVRQTEDSPTSLVDERGLSDVEPRLTRAFWVATILFGAAACWIDRNYSNTDGISYLDVASAFQRHDWAAAINAYWSPLYPFLLSIGLRIFHPSAYKEFSVVHLVNFVIFLCAAAAFRFFAKRVLQFRRHAAARASDARAIVSDEAMLALGYTLFLWSSLALITLSDVSPDMLVATSVYLAAGIVLGMRDQAASALSFFALGAVLGFGYLAKAPMLPMSLVFFSMAVLAYRQFGKAVMRLPLALVAFVIVAGPFIAALSHFQGRLTWGDSAKLNYAWYVDHVPRYHWQGEGHGVGAPLHPSKRLNDSPAVYEFEQPGQATYAIWFDPAYWNAGVHPRPDFKANIQQVLTNADVYGDVFFRQQAAVLVVCLLLFLLGARGGFALGDVLNYAVLLLPVAAALTMYALVHVETRMIGAYVVILWMAFFAAMRSKEMNFVRTAGTCGVAAIALFTFVMMASALMGETVKNGRAQLTAWGDRNALPQWRVVNELHRAGVQPGDKIAWVRPTDLDSNLQNYAWARLAHVQIVAEVPGNDTAAFWANPMDRGKAIEGLRKSQATALIVTNTPAGFAEAGWIKLGQTGYELYSLHSPQ